MPLVWAPLIQYYHPQDLVAVGLSLAGIACVLRRNWVWAGVLFGVAITAQQFALLAFLPVLVLVPRNWRVRLFVSSIAGWVVISLPILALTGGRAWSAILLGTGDARTLGGTLLWDLRLPSGTVLFASRVLPLIVSVLGAWWVRNRLGERALFPVPLVALIAASMSLRIVFEKGLFGYKFMAMTVMLIALDTVRGRFRGQTFAWIALATIAFDPIPLSGSLNVTSFDHTVSEAAPIAFVAVAALWIGWDLAHRRRPHWYVTVFLIVAACAFLQWPLWHINPARPALPKWAWQLILVPTGLALALRPLFGEMRDITPQNDNSDTEAAMRF
jgi:hypothetical protein